MKRFTLFVSLLVVFSVIVSACAPAAETPAASEAPATDAPLAETPAPQEPAAPLVLKIANTANITTWDPIASFSTEASYLANSYEQLVRINPPDSAETYTPLLAESWEVSADGLAYTFHLRSGVKFHDGEPMNADAVKKSIDAATERAGASFIWAPLDNVEVVDDSTVKFNLKWAAPVDLIASSLYGAWIVSPKALEAGAADETFWADGKSYGTGPYMVESYTPDAEIVFTQNPEYWGGWEAGQYEKVVVSIVPEATTRQQMLEGGEVDIATALPMDNIAAFESDPKYTVYKEPSFFNYVGFFNTLKAPLDNVKVRQALSYAIPYDDIIAIGAKGLGTQSYGPVPAGVFPWDGSVFRYSYDIEKAKTLLKEAGHEGGGFSVRLTYAAENATEEVFAPLIKDSFAQIGVDVTIEPLAFGQQWELAKTDPSTAQDMFLLLYWPTYSDAGADNMWSMFYAGAEPPYLNVPKFNLSYWKNDQYNALMDEAGAITATDFAGSKAKYVEALNILVEEAPAVFFFDTMAVFVMPKSIEGFHYNLNYPFVHYFFYQLRAAQ
ncbi:MAG: ABC transporter substrate-binding protein [Anaerolineaceae bacterium]|nr:ABC transporter substrate-binding protein [Anaerolineaceae bacterium]